MLSRPQKTRLPLRSLLCSNLPPLLVPIHTHLQLVLESSTLSFPTGLISGPKNSARVSNRSRGYWTVLNHISSYHALEIFLAGIANHSHCSSCFLCYQYLALGVAFIILPHGLHKHLCCLLGPSLFPAAPPRPPTNLSDLCRVARYHPCRI